MLSEERIKGMMIKALDDLAWPEGMKPSRIEYGPVHTGDPRGMFSELMFVWPNGAPQKTYAIYPTLAGDMRFAHHAENRRRQAQSCLRFYLEHAFKAPEEQIAALQEQLDAVVEKAWLEARL